MSRAVWKFPIILGVMNGVHIPRLAQVRLAALDPATGEPAIWVELDLNAERVERRFLIYRTGHEIEGDCHYPYPIHVGSLIQGASVWHIFEERK